MEQKEINWYKVAENIEDINWQSNDMATAEAGSRKLTLVKHKDGVFACSHLCPHAGGSLVDGFVDFSGNIVCPLHSYKFSLLNGRNVSGEGYRLNVFAVEERPTGIFIALPGADARP